MNILQLASGDLWAGAEVQLYHLVCELGNTKKINLKVVLLNHGQLELMLIENGISVVVLDESKYSTIKIIKHLKNICKENNIDLIHSHRTKEDLIGGVVAKLLGRKSIRTIHGSNEATLPFLAFRGRLVRLLDQYAARFLQHKIIAVSAELKNLLSKNHSEKKIININNSVNIDYILSRSREPLFESINENNINIGFIGRFAPVKNIDLFLEIAKLLISDNTNLPFHFYMIGDGSLFNDIKQQIELEGLSERIHLVGFVENSAPYLKQLDFLMFTSKHEGLPMTLLEAMSLKTPVISVELATIRDVLNGEECGYFIDANNISKSARVISKLVCDEKTAEFKAKKALEVVKKDYSIESNVLKYVELYSEVIEKDKSSL